MNVNWRWHARFRGLLPLSQHALGEDGTLILARPDELASRTYDVLRVAAGGAVGERESLTVETVRRLALTVEAPLRVGVTDDDLYLFQEGKKSRFLTQRRVSYLDLALARTGQSFATAFTDMMFAGQTLCLADNSGKVLWTKDLDAPISGVAISPDGRAVAAGLESGEVLAFDASRAPLWEATLGERAAALLLTGDADLQKAGAHCVAVTASGAAIGIEDGEVTWRTELIAGAGLTPEEVTLAGAARGGLIGVAGGDATGWVVLLDDAGQIVWEHETSARVTGVAFSPSGSLLAVSQVDGEVLLFDLEPLLSSSTRRPADEFQRALAARDAGEAAAAREGLLRVLEADAAQLEACDALIALDAATLARSLAAAERLAEAGKFAEALAALATARIVAPADAELPRRWAAILEMAELRLSEAAAEAESAGDLDGAVMRWRALVGLDPKRRRARKEIGRLNGLAAERAVRDGEAALAVGHEEEALAHWRRAQALAPSEALAVRLRELEVQRFVRAGIALYGQQRFQEAAFQFRKALALQPDHAEALRHLAYISGAGPQSPLSERFSRLE